MRSIDTNIFIRHFTYDDPELSPPATAVLARVEQGAEVVVTSPVVIFEVVLTLERQYKLPKHDVAELVLPFVRLRNLRLEHKRVFREAFELHIAHPIGFAGAYGAAYMRPLGSSEVYTFDEDFDKIPGITRVDPGEEVG